MQSGFFWKIVLNFLFFLNKSIELYICTYIENLCIVREKCRHCSFMRNTSWSCASMTRTPFRYIVCLRKKKIVFHCDNFFRKKRTTKKILFESYSFAKEIKSKICKISPPKKTETEKEIKINPRPLKFFFLTSKMNSIFFDCGKKKFFLFK